MTCCCFHNIGTRSRLLLLLRPNYTTYVVLQPGQTERAGPTSVKVVRQTPEGRVLAFQINLAGRPPHWGPQNTAGNANYTLRHLLICTPVRFIVVRVRAVRRLTLCTRYVKNRRPLEPLPHYRRLAFPERSSARERRGKPGSGGGSGEHR